MPGDRTFGGACDLVQGHPGCVRAELAQRLVEPVQACRLQFVIADGVATALRDVQEIEEAVGEGDAVGDCGVVFMARSMGLWYHRVAIAWGSQP